MSDTPPASVPASAHGHGPTGLTRRRALREGLVAALMASSTTLVTGAAVRANPAPRIPIVAPPIRPRPGLDFRLVDTRGCPQVMGCDPWGCLTVQRFDAAGQPHPVGPDDLLAAAAAQPVVIIVHGNRYTTSDVLRDSYLIADTLDRRGYLPPQTLVLAFSWPSERVYLNEVRDQNEKGRRAMVAGYGLASILARFAPGSRVGLIGHSDGARTIAGALHLLGGGAVSSLAGDPPIALPAPAPPLRLRSVLIASATDHHWFNPGERLDRVLPVSESVMNLYNLGDIPLAFYPIGRVTDHRRALGRASLHRHDADLLGAYAARLVEHDLRPYLRTLHVFGEVITHPTVAAWVAPYVWAPGT